MTDRYKVLFAVVVSIVFYCIIYYNLPGKDKTLINVLGIIGFLLSILGIVIAYIQILSVKKISKITQEKVKETQDRLEERIRDIQKRVQENMAAHSNLHMISDLSAKGAMINEIQAYLRNTNIEMCVIRMKDLKVVLISLRSQTRYSNLVKKADFITAFDNFHINLDNLQKHHFRAGKIDFVKVNKDLEDLSGIFLSVEQNLKKLQ